MSNACTLTGLLLASISTHVSDRTVLSKFKLPHNFLALAVVMCDRASPAT
ncbi:MULTISPECIES: hypothetical protein [unclassified Microcoleus]